MRWKMFHFIKLVLQTLIIFLFYYLGLFIQKQFDLFVPGSVIGLILLFVLLSLKIIKQKWINVSAHYFMKYLAIFFIPSTVGLIGYLYLFSGKGIILVVIPFLST